jgi:protein gp37
MENLEMSQKSRIEWTETTWNPVTGCTKLSPGCQNCYAEILARRLKAMGSQNYQNGFNVTCHPAMLAVPPTWRKPRLVFVNSMSDLFHDNVPESFIQEIYAVMAESKEHTFQVLTKRAERLAALAPKLPWPTNIWAGVTVENSSFTHRIDLLRTAPATVRFLSLEPLLGSIPNLNLAGIHWVIAGGESGPKARPMDKAWVRDIRDQCIAAQVPFFFKQWGGVRKKAAGKELDGRIWNEMPCASTSNVNPAA